MLLCTSHTQSPIRTSTLAAKGLWNLVSRMSQDKEFIQECLALGVVGSLCGAARGAADLLVALEEVGGAVEIARAGTIKQNYEIYPPTSCPLFHPI